MSEKTSIPFFSAGNLISEVNGEKYGANKLVNDKEQNQVILIDKVNQLHENQGTIILAGHFCIFGSNDTIELLPDSVFDKLKLSKIVLLETESSLVSKHLRQRDGKAYAISVLDELVEKERDQAKKTSCRLGCPLFVYRMRFNDDDLSNLLTYVMEEIS